MTEREKIELREKIRGQREKIHLKKQEIIEGLPHLYGRKWYRWARAFFESRNKMCLLCAANQISKSSTQIRKKIDWATDMKKWPELWPNRKPRTFWYFYPSLEIATDEFNTKWQEFLPAKNYKSHPIYGWSHETGEKKKINRIDFNSGVSIHFKTYNQDIANLQASTVDDIGCDEEMPDDFYSELMARMIASDGYFSMVFTATLNQEMWFRAMEGKGAEELFPDAFKQQITMYECQVYEDGTPGAFTLERIKEVEARCKSEAEKQRRVYGRFVSDSGRKYSSFDPTRHYVAPFEIAKDWLRLVAVDIGTGLEAHPAAISFLAVRPDMRYGVIYKAWRGEHVQTTNGDIYNKYLALKGMELLNFKLYDPGGKDFGTIAMRAGDNFTKATNSHEVGEDIVNTLFQNDMLQLFSGDDEIGKLGVELMLLLSKTDKRKAKDDLCDTLRYNVAQVPWDFSHIKLVKPELKIEKGPNDPMTPEEIKALEIRMRRGEPDPRKADNTWEELENEISEWNEYYGN